MVLGYRMGKTVKRIELRLNFLECDQKKGSMDGVFVNWRIGKRVYIRRRSEEEAQG